MKSNSLKAYLHDPFLNSLMEKIKNAAAIQPSLIDLTQKYDIRYFGNARSDSLNAY